MSWLKMHGLGHVVDEIGDSLLHITKADERLTPNLRALRLTMTVCDTLLSMGVSAGGVVSRALDITETYCEQPVHIDVSSNLVTLSQLRGLSREPLTLVRPVVMRDINNMTIQAVQDLVYRIRRGQLELKEAEAELDKILKKPATYPQWLISIARATLASGVVLMFTTNWRIMLVTFVITWLVDRLVIWLTNAAIAAFFRHAAGGVLVTLAAALVNQLTLSGVEFFAGMNPTIIVVGGIIMLLSGLAVVGAIQDAIDEYYITANARILKVVMLTAGIVVGVLVGLNIAHSFGFGITVSPDPLRPTELPFQIVAGVLVASAFAVATQTRKRAIVWAGLIGGLALICVYAVTHLGLSTVAASGTAALVVGLLAKLFSRFWRTPSSGIIAAGIIPLVPGLALYTALMQMVNYPPGDPLFTRGIGTLFTAIAIALSIAAGASLGYVLSRPFYQRRTYLRNFMPFANYMRSQLKATQKHGLARFALNRTWDPTDEKVDTTVKRNP